MSRLRDGRAWPSVLNYRRATLVAPKPMTLKTLKSTAYMACLSIYRFLQAGGRLKGVAAITVAGIRLLLLDVSETADRKSESTYA